MWGQNVGFFLKPRWFNSWPNLDPQGWRSPFQPTISKAHVLNQPSQNRSQRQDSAAWQVCDLDPFWDGELVKWPFWKGFFPDLQLVDVKRSRLWITWKFCYFKRNTCTVKKTHKHQIYIYIYISLPNVILLGGKPLRCEAPKRREELDQVTSALHDFSPFDEGSSSSDEEESVTPTKRKHRSNQ